MDEIKDKDLLVGNDAFTDDLRESLRRREAKRLQVDVPVDFLDNVMQQVESERTYAKAKTWRIALASLAIAACTIIAVLLVWPKGDEQKIIEDNLIVRKEKTMSLSPSNLQPATMEKYIAPKTVAKNHTEKKLVSQQTAIQTENIDLSAHYMAELESGLADVRDSCYLAQVERMIADNEELQKLMNDMTNQKQ